MAIVKIDPQDWQQFNAVQLDSDEVRRFDAQREMAQWANDHGFAVAAGGWVRQVLYRDGREVYRGVCYRLMEEVRPDDPRLRIPAYTDLAPSG